jgi:hypothetical protein
MKYKYSSAVALAVLLPTLGLGQIAAAGGGGGTAAGGNQQRRPVAPTRGIDLSCMNPAQRVLQVVMVRLQLAGILNEETVPTSRAIVIGMNYVMRISLTPQQQAIIDPQVWRVAGRPPLGPEWKDVLNSGSIVKTLANLSPQQQQAIGAIYQRCSVNWDAFRKAGGESMPAAQRMTLMYGQQEPYLAEVRQHLSPAQQKEWDQLVSTFWAKMDQATGRRR